MPKVVNKIIINGNIIRSYWKILKGYFAGILMAMLGSEEMALEIQEEGWLDLSPVVKFKERQEANCSNFHAATKVYIEALKSYHEEQINISEEMRAWIDTKRDERIQNQQQP